jgi:hypothetical protein
MMAFSESEILFKRFKGCMAEAANPHDAVWSVWQQKLVWQDTRYVTGG